MRTRRGHMQNHHITPRTPVGPRCPIAASTFFDVRNSRLTQQGRNTVENIRKYPGARKHRYIIILALESTATKLSWRPKAPQINYPGAGRTAIRIHCANWKRACVRMVCACHALQVRLRLDRELPPENRVRVIWPPGNMLANSAVHTMLMRFLPRIRQSELHQNRSPSIAFCDLSDTLDSQSCCRWPPTNICVRNTVCCTRAFCIRMHCASKLPGTIAIFSMISALPAAITAFLCEVSEYTVWTA